MAEYKGQTAPKARTNMEDQSYLFRVQGLGWGCLIITSDVEGCGHVWFPVSIVLLQTTP